MMILYVKAPSKKALNEQLKNGESVWGTYYSPFGENHFELSRLTEDATVKIYSKTVHGSPYAKAYGTYRAATRRVQ